jgi:hypothetical protein
MRRNWAQRIFSDLHGMSFLVRTVSAVLIAFSFISQSASALTLEEIEVAYAKKIEQLGAYQLRYAKRIEDKKSGVITSAHRYVHYLISSEIGYRLETSIVKDAQKPPVPFHTKTDNQHRFRVLSFTNDGKPHMGTIRPASSPSSAYDQIMFTPIGLAGLHDSSPFFTVGTGNTYMSDIRALAQDPQAVLSKEPVTLQGEKAYLVEWPADAPHPTYRFWLSTTKNLALLKCESYILNNSGVYEMLVQTTNEDFVEITSGLFLPRKSEFRRPERQELSAQVMTIEAISFDLNIAASPDDFSVYFPDGTHVNNRTIGIKYREGGMLSLVANNVGDLVGAVCLIVVVLVLVFFITFVFRKFARTTAEKD